MSWQPQPISSITHVVTKGTTPTTLGRPFTDEGVNFVKAKALNGESGLELAGFSHIDEDTHELLGRSILHEDDVLITIAGAQVGRCGYVKAEHLPANTNQAVGIVRIDKSKAIPRFVYYFFKQTSTFTVCQSLGGQAAQPNVNLTVLKSIAVPLPALSTQRAIADVLSAYDDLIENNRRRMALLEEAARQIYREWFVRLRFPGHEHTRITNGVPEAWDKRRLDELADVTMGQSPPSSLYNEVGEGLPFHQGVGDFGDRFVTHRAFTTAKNRLSESGDILCSVRAPVGRLNVTTDKIVIGRGLAAIRSKFGQQSFLLRQLHVHFFKEDMIGSGAIFASVSKRELFAQRMLTPHEQLISLFEEKVCPIDEQIRTLFVENHKLRAARDFLLPRLMSGEIAV